MSDERVAADEAARPSSGPTRAAVRRSWLAIALSTLLVVLSYRAIAIGMVAGAAGDAERGQGLVAFGVGLVPFVFLVLAFGSAHRNAPGAVIKAMALALLIGAPGVVLGGVALGVVLGYGAGGVVALRRDPDTRLGPRWWAVLVGTVLAAVVLATDLGVGLLLAPVMPLTSIGVADTLTRRAEET